MAGYQKVQGKLVLNLDRFDGGLNTKDAPSRIEPTESPSCLNVVFDDQGAVRTRYGTTFYNSSTSEATTASDLGSCSIDGGISFNGSMIVWANGTLYRSSGATFVAVPSATCAFASGASVAAVVYQSMIICSDGTNGPFRYTGDGFYKLGIPIPTASPKCISNTVGSYVPTGTWDYAVSFINTAAVEGEVGTATALILVDSAMVSMSGVALGTLTTQPVTTRYIYRRTSVSGTYRRVGTLADNAATTFTDSMGTTTWSVQTTAQDDGTAPTPFRTIVLHKDRLFFDDSADRTILRYTDYTNPHVSQAENYFPLQTKDFDPILAVAQQEDLIVAFKKDSIWIVSMTDPSDDSSWSYIRSPANFGIVGAKAFCNIPNGLLFLGVQNGQISGFHVLSGVNVVETASTAMRSESISERIEANVLAFPRTYWANTCMATYGNRAFCAVTAEDDTYNNHLYWFDLTRRGSQGQPGSWSLWDGRATQVQNFWTHEGKLYAGSNRGDGWVLQMDYGTSYEDADGTAINSYFWTRQYGGEGEVESWIKDFRKVNLWYKQLGTGNMNVRYRVDTDTTDGGVKSFSLGTPVALWDVAVWDTSVFSMTDPPDAESQFSLGPLLGRRIQLRFDNQNTAGQAFKVYRAKVHMNLRRQR